MKTAAGLLVAQAPEVSIPLLLESDLAMLALANLIMPGRLLVPVVVLRSCSTTLVASTAFVMLDGCLSKMPLSLIVRQHSSLMMDKRKSFTTILDLTMLTKHTFMTFSSHIILLYHLSYRSCSFTRRQNIAIGIRTEFSYEI